MTSVPTKLESGLKRQGARLVGDVTDWFSVLTLSTISGMLTVSTPNLGT